MEQRDNAVNFGSVFWGFLAVAVFRGVPVFRGVLVFLILIPAVAQGVDGSVHWLSYYPLDNDLISFDSTYPLDSSFIQWIASSTL